MALLSLPGSVSILEETGAFLSGKFGSLDNYNYIYWYIIIIIIIIMLTYETAFLELLKSLSVSAIRHSLHGVNKP